MSAIVKSLCVSFAILCSFATLFAVADALTFNVGGDGVWAINPKENYNTWAERNRFQVNDTLYFKYAKGSDSVQQVMKADYDYCNTNNPLKKFDDGESIFKFDRSGPFYFISGNKDQCKKGQKLIVVVLAIRHHPTVPISPAKPPSMAQPPKSPSPVSPIAPAHPPSTAQPPKSAVAPVSPPSKSQPPKSPQAPSPVSHSPAHSPSQSPMSPSPSPKSPSPVSHSPSNAPSPSSKSPSPVSHSPAQAPTQSPLTPSPSPKSPSPSSSSSDQSPTSSPADQTPTSSPSPSEADTSPDNATAPAPSSRNSASSVAVTSVMTAVLGLAFTVLLFV